MYIKKTLSSFKKNSPKAGLSEAAAAPKLKLPICGAGLLETGVPNCWHGILAPKLNPPVAAGADPEGAGCGVLFPNANVFEEEL